MLQKIKSFAQFGLPFLISILLLWYAIRGMSARDFWSSLQSVPPWLLILMFLFPLGSMLLRAWRWRLLLKPVREFSYYTIFAFTNIGFMANNLLPAHAGEVVKPYLLARKTGVNGVAAFATVFLERLMDMVVLILIMLWVIISVPLPSELKWAGGLMGGAGAGLLISLFFLSGENSRGLKWILRLFRFLPQRLFIKLGDVLSTFMAGMRSLQNKRIIALSAAITIVIWVGLIINITILLAGYPGTQNPLPELGVASAAVLVVLAFAIALPTSPGYFGVTQAAFWIVLQQFGFSQESAIGSSIVFNLTQYITITLLGLFYLFKEGFGWSQLVGAGHNSAPAAANHTGKK